TRCCAALVTSWSQTASPSIEPLQRIVDERPIRSFLTVGVCESRGRCYVGVGDRASIHHRVIGVFSDTNDQQLPGGTRDRGLSCFVFSVDDDPVYSGVFVV